MKMSDRYIQIGQKFLLDNDQTVEITHIYDERVPGNRGTRLERLHLIWYEMTNQKTGEKYRNFKNFHEFKKWKIKPIKEGEE